ncbi:unnamed protein product [Wuchereria bancrofti]|uniref:ACB domain-containing protein n=2 Tax=Wuchereria bancrofti TaxID=6293 RepID=A0A3P7EH04_WUCBA|nr:unnamed protein product [Wuchereria bancrofti]
MVIFIRSYPSIAVMLPDCVETSSESIHDAAFKAAVDIIQSMPKKDLVSISTSQKLRFYSLFKQGTNGRCNTPCPPIWHAVDRMKCKTISRRYCLNFYSNMITVLKRRAWDALGSMDSLEAKKTYVIEFKNIINTMQQKYDIAELTKGSDDRMKVLLREKLTILGYDITGSKIGEDLDDSGKQSYTMAEENYEMKKHSSNNGTNELWDQCSESSTSTGEYVDAVCCNHEPCACCQEQLSNQRLLRSTVWCLVIQIPVVKTPRQVDIVCDYQKIAFSVKHQITESIFADTNVQLLLTKIDNLEQMKGEVSETLLNVIDKRIAYPRMITSYISEAANFRMKRMEEAELVWQAESMGKKDVEKMLEMINKMQEVEKENDALLHRVEKLKRRNKELEKTVKMNDEIIRSVVF